MKIAAIQRKILIR